MDYYHNIITKKSWQELKNLQSAVKFVLIGGWAAYLYTQELKSKDIDILVDYDQLASLRHHYDLVKNNRLKKYEARKGEVQMDIYLPHYSQIGIPVEKLMRQTSSVAGFMVLKKEWLIALKMYVLALRARSVKGEKDFLDILSLFKTGRAQIDKVKLVIKNYRLGKQFNFFIDLFNERIEAREINLNQHQYKKLKYFAGL